MVSSESEKHKLHPCRLCGAEVYLYVRQPTDSTSYGGASIRCCGVCVEVDLDKTGVRTVVGRSGWYAIEQALDDAQRTVKCKWNRLNEPSAFEK